jgi:hypothetical protein
MLCLRALPREQVHLFFLFHVFAAVRRSGDPTTLALPAKKPRHGFFPTPCFFLLDHPCHSTGRLDGEAQGLFDQSAGIKEVASV